MNISLTPELDSYVHEKVQTGMYHSASEVIREGLRLLKEQDQLRQARLDQLRSDVKVGTDQVDRGEYTEYSTSDFSSLASEIKAKGRSLRAKQKGE
ncbi:MAG: type II toxin-antitoxin system ParD family antitoxin [Capsulimonas sp.]|uniref:type II toxin-antitoxin system ParD family antitoxin n=1 Tax=Capsulimonas sp. TaxID=2494211 RepID=UPI0032661320